MANFYDLGSSKETIGLNSTPVKSRTGAEVYGLRFLLKNHFEILLLSLNPIQESTAKSWPEENAEHEQANKENHESTGEFLDYRWLAGVEATMSELDRRTGVKRLRVRGFKAVRFSVTLKSIGINLFRAAAVRKAAANPDNRGRSRVRSTLNHAILFVKEQFQRIFNPLRKYFELHPNLYEHKLINLI